MLTWSGSVNYAADVVVVDDEAIDRYTSVIDVPCRMVRVLLRGCLFASVLLLLMLTPYSG